MIPCTCAEANYVVVLGKDNKPIGSTQPTPPVHDCAYIARRNLLIPQAEKIACEQTPHPKGTSTPAWRYAWSRNFAQAMRDLTEQ